MRPKEIPLLSPKPFAEYTALEFLEYVKSIRLVSTSESLSKHVEGIHISNKKRLITKVPKTKESFTDLEIEALCGEFKVDKETLVQNLLKKKIKVLDANGQERTKAKGNAKPRKAAKRKAKGKDELQQPRTSAILPQESPLHIEPETSK